MSPDRKQRTLRGTNSMTACLAGAPPPALPPCPCSPSALLFPVPPMLTCAFFPSSGWGLFPMVSLASSLPAGCYQQAPGKAPVPLDLGRLHSQGSAGSELYSQLLS